MKPFDRQIHSETMRNCTSKVTSAENRGQRTLWRPSNHTAGASLVPMENPAIVTVPRRAIARTDHSPAKYCARALVSANCLALLSAYKRSSKFQRTERGRLGPLFLKLGTVISLLQSAQLGFVGRHLDQLIDDARQQLQRTIDFLPGVVASQRKTNRPARGGVRNVHSAEHR